MRNYIDELRILCEFDPSFSKQKLLNVKNNHGKLIGRVQTREDYIDLFHDFSLVQSVIRIIYNYRMMVDEFENGANPFYGTNTELKKHPKNLKTVLNQLIGVVEVSKWNDPHLVDDLLFRRHLMVS